MDHSTAEDPQISHKEFTFADETSQESLTVSIPEVLDAQFGMYAWPCAVVLAQYLWTHRDKLRGKRLLELGAGVSLPGVVAARCGGHVILSDSADYPACLQNCRRSCEANGLRVVEGGDGVNGEVRVVGLTWGEVSPDLVMLPKLDFILGSDVFYEPENFEDAVVTVAFLLKRNPEAQFLTSYQIRSAEWSLEVLLSRWKLSCRFVPLHHFSANKPQLAGSNLPGNHSIQMMIISLETKD